MKRTTYLAKQLSTTNNRFAYYDDTEMFITLVEQDGRAIIETSGLRGIRNSFYHTSLLKEIVCTDNTLMVYTRNSIYVYKLLEDSLDIRNLYNSFIPEYDSIPEVDVK